MAVRDRRTLPAERLGATGPDARDQLHPRPGSRRSERDGALRVLREGVQTTHARMRRAGLGDKTTREKGRRGTGATVHRAAERGPTPSCAPAPRHGGARGAIRKLVGLRQFRAGRTRRGVVPLAAESPPGWTSAARQVRLPFFHVAADQIHGAIDGGAAAGRRGRHTWRCARRNGRAPRSVPFALARPGTPNDGAATAGLDPLGATVAFPDLLATARVTMPSIFPSAEPSDWRPCAIIVQNGGRLIVLLLRPRRPLAAA